MNSYFHESQNADHRACDRSVWTSVVHKARRQAGQRSRSQGRPEEDSGGPVHLYARRHCNILWR